MSNAKQGFQKETAERDYDLELYKSQKPDYDGVASHKRKVQIKATIQDSLTFKTMSGYYLGSKLDKDGNPEQIFNGPSRIISKAFKNRKGKKPFPIRLGRLKELNTLVPDSERIGKRKAPIPPRV